MLHALRITATLTRAFFSADGCIQSDVLCVCVVSCRATAASTARGLPTSWMTCCVLPRWEKMLTWEQAAHQIWSLGLRLAAPAAQQAAPSPARPTATTPRQAAPPCSARCCGTTPTAGAAAPPHCRRRRRQRRWVPAAATSRVSARRAARRGDPSLQNRPLAAWVRRRRHPWPASRLPSALPAKRWMTARAPLACPRHSERAACPSGGLGWWRGSWFLWGVRSGHSRQQLQQQEVGVPGFQRVLPLFFY